MLRNCTKGTIVANYVWVADNFWKRLKGLLGTKSLPVGYGMIIRPCNSVHTFGMAYPIDILFVDCDDRISKIVVGMPSGRMVMGSGSSYVVELPLGTVRQTHCMVGDVLKIM